MKFWEVLPLAVEQGKKIRLKTWTDFLTVDQMQAAEGIRWDGYGLAWVHDGRSVCVGGDWLKLDDWEVVEENPHEKGTNLWAAWELDHGKVLTFGDGRAHYRYFDRLLEWRPNRSGPFVWLHTETRWRANNFTLKMLAATDWRHAEEEA